MSSGILTFVILLLIPTLAEAIDQRNFAVNIPGFPLTLGRTLFVLVGVVEFLRSGAPLLRSTLFKGLFLAYAGTLLGAAFSNDVLDNAMRSSALILMVIGACGLAGLCNFTRFRILLDVFFAVTYIYWCLYVAQVTRGGVSYSKEFIEGAAINHHIPGLCISISTTYLAVRFFTKGKRLAWTGYALFGIGIACCLLSESRSNFLATAILMLLVMYRGERNSPRLIAVLVITIVAAAVIGRSLLGKSAELTQRFDVGDTHYQSKTTMMRVDYQIAGLGVIVYNPLGRGIRNTYVAVGGRNLLVHNQYLSLVIAGGLVSLIGVVYWLASSTVLVLKLFTRGHTPYQQPFVAAAVLAWSSLALTLLTIEYTDLIFFILVAMVIYAHDTFKSTPLSRLPTRAHMPSQRTRLLRPSSAVSS